ncbi:MAG: hydantoinase/oxoprolinase family protein [Candidatus Riflebacteria bacterium]|nr:hydantoinase/oxoprolinase family protein [Candidatus Riflebacteria bacterium]
MLIGIDTGGTNIDGVLIENGQIIKKIKNPVDRKDLFNTVLKALNELIEGRDLEKIKRINLSTTISTNAIVENKISPVAILLQSGPGINNDFSDLTSDLYNLTGYVDHRGKVVKGIDSKELKEAEMALNLTKNRHLAAVSKFSTRNPDAENAIADYFSDKVKHITLGHKLSGRLNFPRRVNTAYLNAAVNDIFSDFAINILRAVKEKGIKAPVFILKADGGTMPVSQATASPVETILSGPAASFMGISALASAVEDALLLDIGGTTSDIFFLVSGVPVFAPQGIQIAGKKTLVRSIFSVSIGLGGDSLLQVNEKQQLQIGPERKGLPVVFGGAAPALTDAAALKGLISVESEALEKAKQTLKPLADKLGLTLENFANTTLTQAAKMIATAVNENLAVLNSKTLYTVKEVLEGRQIKPSKIIIVGGPANLMAPYLEKELGWKASCPKHFEIANAIGAALAKPTVEMNLIADTGRKILSVPEAGVYEPINANFNLSDARKTIVNLLEKAAKDMGDSNFEAEITEESSFNMIDGFRSGQNIRIKAQLRPGLIANLNGGEE